MVSHEYGTKSQRPHHHAIIFGWNPDNQKLQTYSKGGHPLFTSEEVSKIWDKGYHSIGEANAKTAYYIAAYSLKGKEHEITNKEDGEVHMVKDRFDCSKNPGIGLRYFQKNYKQIIDSEGLVPRYYQKKLEQIDPDYFEIYESRKMEQFRVLDPLQKYSKFVISCSKKNLNNGEFRKSAPSDKSDHETLNYLKTMKKEMIHEKTI